VPKIVHIISGLHTGGAETMLWRLLKGGNRQCFDPVVIALMRGGALEEEIRALGIPLYHAEMRQGRPSLRAFARIAGFLRQEKPDVVQGWMVHGNLAALSASLLVSPRPRVFWAVHHSLGSFEREKRLTAFLIRLSSSLSARAEKIVYVSEVSRRQHERLGFDADRSVMIPNGIDTDLFVPSEAHRISLREELNLSAGTLLIGVMGRFHPQKNHAGFLHAARRVIACCPEARIVFAGSGMEPGNEELVSLVRKSGLEGVVHLLGERRDMARLNAALDIAVSASSFGEALSLAVGEAMACAVPCVVTNVGDNGVLVGSTGVVVRPNDLEALAEGCLSLIRLKSSGRQTLGASARERILRNYALPMTIRRYEELYSSCSKGERS